MNIRGEKYNFSTKEIQVKEGPMTYAGSQSLRKEKSEAAQLGH